MNRLRLAIELERALAEYDNNGSKLARAIYGRDVENQKPRLLRSIIEGKATSFKLADLELIEKYLASKGRPVGLFEAKSIIEALVESGHVSFFVPTRPRDDKARSYMSTWDVRAFNYIAEKINHVRLATKLELKEVPHRPEAGERLPGEEFDDLTGDVKSSVFIGSPNVTDLATHALGRMYHVDDPFESIALPNTMSELPLPFYFVFSPNGNTTSSYCSRFALNTEDLDNLIWSDLDTVDQIRQGNAQAMIIDGKECLAKYNSRNERHDYGIISIQRTSDSTLAVVIAGLSGPGTYAAAQKFCELALDIPDSEEKPTPTYVGVRARVKRDPDVKRGDDRTVVGEIESVTEPRQWRKRT